jgi:hypothetical protein
VYNAWRQKCWQKLEAKEQKQTAACACRTRPQRIILRQSLLSAKAFFRIVMTSLGRRKALCRYTYSCTVECNRKVEWTCMRGEYILQLRSFPSASSYIAVGNQRYHYEFERKTRSLHILTTFKTSSEVSPQMLFIST